MYGDGNSSMNVMLGYDVKDLNYALRNLLRTLIGPFVILIILGLYIFIMKIPMASILLLQWLVWVLLPFLIMMIFLFFRIYYKMNMHTLAEYLKVKDLKKVLEKEGFKQ